MGRYLFLTIGTVSIVVSDRIGYAEGIYDFFSKEEVSTNAFAIITSLSKHDDTLSQPRLFQISNQILKGLKVSEMDFSEFNTVMKLLKDKCGLVKVTANRNWYPPETVEFKD